MIPHLFGHFNELGKCWFRKLAILGYQIENHRLDRMLPNKKVRAPAPKDIVLEKDILTSESNKITSLHVLHHS